jgi:hypothetical protein
VKSFSFLGEVAGDGIVHDGGRAGWDGSQAQVKLPVANVGAEEQGLRCKQSRQDGWRRLQRIGEKLEENGQFV